LGGKETLAYFGKAAGFAGKTVAAAYTKIYGDKTDRQSAKNSLSPLMDTF
jgi:hypothetical protein